MASHTNTCTTGLTRAILALSDDLSILNLVELQYRKLHELVLVTNLLGLGVDLLLSLLSTTTQTKHQVKSGLLLNVVVRESAAILELLAGEDQTLLIRRNTFLVLDLLLDIVNAIRRLNLKGDGLSRQGLDENLRSERARQRGEEQR